LKILASSPGPPTAKLNFGQHALTSAATGIDSKPRREATRFSLQVFRDFFRVAQGPQNIFAGDFRDVIA
jgi:hypothetical protein